MRHYGGTASYIAEAMLSLRGVHYGDALRPGKRQAEGALARNQARAGTAT